jgi:hypothetical protein
MSRDLTCLVSVHGVGFEAASGHEPEPSSWAQGKNLVRGGPVLDGSPLIALNVQPTFTGGEPCSARQFSI